MRTTLDVRSLSVKGVLTPDRLREISRAVLPEAGSILSDGILICLLTFLFIMEMAGEIGVKPGPLAESLAYYGSDARSYVSVTAKTAGINALINLAFLIVMGVDTPVDLELPLFFPRLHPNSGFRDCANSAHFRDAADVWLEESLAGSRWPDRDEFDRRQRCHTDLHEARGGRLIPRYHAVARCLGLLAGPHGRHPRHSLDAGVAKVRHQELERTGTCTEPLRMTSAARGRDLAVAPRRGCRRSSTSSAPQVPQGNRFVFGSPFAMSPRGGL